MPMIRKVFLSLLLPMVSPLLLLLRQQNFSTTFRVGQTPTRKPAEVVSEVEGTPVLQCCMPGCDRAQHDPDSQGQPFVDAEVTGHERNNFHQDHQQTDQRTNRGHYALALSRRNLVVRGAG